MKAIISHDIDHISVTEHLFRDTIVPKFMARMHIELVLGKITFREYMLRWTDFVKNKWQNIDELITFNNIKQVPSSFFIGVNKGIGLNYSNELALVWIEQMKNRGCEIGVHGIHYEDLASVKNELDRFLNLSGLCSAGIRMHYVRKDDNTLNFFSEAGYKYDSTVHAFENPYKIGTMWEFPFQIMDGWVIENGKSWQSIDLNEAKDKTKRLIDQAHQMDLKYLGIDFHDRYFSNSFRSWLHWYTWLIEYLLDNKIGFVNFNTAIQELESSHLKSAI
ncbi:MAG: hypothetical protein ACXVPQ_09660 [Bacteroidia bacterium]